MPARVMIVVTALMTINSLNNTFESRLPKTSSITVGKHIMLNRITKHLYVQAIGVYMWACFFFAIASFLQTAFVIYTDKLRKSIEENIKEDKQRDSDVEKQLGTQLSSTDSVHWNPLLTIFKFNVHMNRDKSSKRKRSKIARLVREPKMLKVWVC